MKKTFGTLFFLLACGAINILQAQETTTRDLFQDTWVATDALGREMPRASECPLKTDKKRTVGIFYITWHDEGKYNKKQPYAGDITKLFEECDSMRFNDKHPMWTEGEFHWGEPEAGYFLSQDEWLIRRDMSMLADAGVDVIILDVTNGVLYWDEWEVLFRTMQQMREEGNQVPQFCFWSFNNNPVNVVHQLYDRYYAQGKYRDFWFMWEGKPLLLYNSKPQNDANGFGHKVESDYRQEVKDFFTLRDMWWGYYEWYGERYVGTEDNWSFGYEMHDSRVSSLSPFQRASKHKGRVEEMAVTPAQHSSTLTGKSWRISTGEPELGKGDMPVPTYVPWLGKTVENPTGYGIYFQDRWDEALSVDPDFIYLNDWNEWIAGRWFLGPDPNNPLDTIPAHFMRRDVDYVFIDQYNAEFNRTIQPMKGGYTDNFYMQMAENIRRYKGARELPIYEGYSSVKIDGIFDEWSTVKAEYRDTRGDVAHRHHHGYAGYDYVDNTGRNDILTSRVATDKRNLYFYVECDKAITKPEGSEWMLLFIDADQDASTGWEGFDFVVNRQLIDNSTTTLMRWDEALGSWQLVGRVPYALKDNKMELQVPRKLLGMKGDNMAFNFKWSDNAQQLDNIISVSIYGDTAPNRRFCYQYQWKK